MKKDMEIFLVEKEIVFIRLNLKIDHQKNKIQKTKTAKKFIIKAGKLD